MVRIEQWKWSIRRRRKTNIVRGVRMKRGQRVFILVQF